MEALGGRGVFQEFTVRKHDIQRRVYVSTDRVFLLNSSLNIFSIMFLLVETHYSSS